MVRSSLSLVNSVLRHCAYSSDVPAWSTSSSTSRSSHTRHCWIRSVPRVGQQRLPVMVQYLSDLLLPDEGFHQ